jgi:ribosomal protein L12E/L44/L45/RPP1/RPP2
MNPVTTNLISDEETLTAILNSTGKPVDAAQVKAVVEKLKGKQVHDVFI